MSRRPSVADEAAYPPYHSRPGLATSDVETAPAVPGARAPYRAGSAVGSGGGGEGRYLQAAQEIELTQEDKQEGYDATLLNLPERNTTAPAPPAHEPLPGFLPSTGPSAALAATLPYASRARDDSFDDVDHKRRSNGATGGSGGGTRKKGVRHDTTSAPHDYHRSRTSGGGAARKGSSRRRASKKRQLKWYQKPLALGALLALLLVVGLAVGLGVGLTKGKKSDDGKVSTADVGSSAPVPPGGVQPSQSGSTSGNDVQVSASSSDGAVGVAGVTMQPTAAAADDVAPTVVLRPAVARVTAAAVEGEAPARRAARWA